ncbi:hypothetical protein SAMN05216553_104167 [Lentzea fradiae]|uniref:Uncharacterized protein n=1 Tax=Lentzea fradiae TaxID=200378 RepID=A0A1G7PZT9_9PSEU|nr:hypothetical protein [Lentzea fradiae]SDF91738.1 hypothetical protein SAMN05216553_104167 [Lentzea fradiae]
MYPVWQLILGGFAMLAGGVGLGVTLTYGLVFVAMLGGLAYAVGVTALAERKWIALPAFVLGIAAPFLLTSGTHSVVMQRVGHVETCAVVSADENPFVKHPSVEYVLACPSGEVELERDWNTRLRGREAEVLIGPAVRPMFADSTRWNLLAVTSVLGAMILLVPVARLVRKRQ